MSIDDTVIDKKLTNIVVAYLDNDIEIETSEEETKTSDSESYESGILRSIFFISGISLVLFYSSLYVIYNLYNFYDSFKNKCPDSYGIYYIIFCSTGLNILYYFLLKLYINMENDKKLTYINLSVIFTNLLCIGANHYTIDNCIENNFSDNLYEISYYYDISHFIAIFLSFSSLLYCHLKNHIFKIK